MKVVFWDKLRETYKSFENVWTVEEEMTKHNGRYVKFWFIRFEDGTNIALKCKDYTIDRVVNEK